MEWSRRFSKGYLSSETFSPEHQAQLEGLDVENDKDLRKMSKIFVAHADAKVARIERDHPNIKEETRFTVQKALLYHNEFPEGTVVCVLNYSLCLLF